jgi:glucokinase
MLHDPPVGNDYGCAVGLDVGGTKIASGLVAFPSGRVLAKRLIPTQAKRGGQAVLDDAIQEAQALLPEAHRSELEFLGIGIGIAEMVDQEGNVTSEHRIAWRGIPVQARFSELAPAVVGSDVRAGALAEALFGAAEAYRLFAYVTIGTGISSTLVQDRVPFAGARGNAILLASSPLTTVCSHCGTVLSPVLEEIASGPGLVATYNRRTNRNLTRAEEVTAAADVGDAVALAVVKKAAMTLGVSVGFLVNLLDPEAVVVGGGLGVAGGVYWSTFVQATREHIWSDTTRALPIVPAKLGKDAGFIGAAAALWQQQYTLPRPA